jgi:hypothetical protein
MSVIASLYKKFKQAVMTHLPQKMITFATSTASSSSSINALCLFASLVSKKVKQSLVIRSFHKRMDTRLVAYCTTYYLFEP